MMKGLQGIAIAAALGIVGAVCNWLYIASQASDYEKVSFVAIDKAARINLGDKFQLKHFQPVAIPKRSLGNLDQVAVLWRDRHAVAGMPATQSYQGGEILLWQQLKTPGHKPLSEMIGEEERLLWLPVDPRTFDPTRVNPGDQVSFRVPRLPAGKTSGNSGSPGQSEIIGPFRIVALGSRTASHYVRKAADAPAGRENVMAVSVRVEGNRLEPKAERIAEVLQRTNFEGVQVLLHPAISGDG